jgi:hypothetical protein
MMVGNRLVMECVGIEAGLLGTKWHNRGGSRGKSDAYTVG